mgnify:CR=1 FL=1
MSLFGGAGSRPLFFNLSMVSAPGNGVPTVTKELQPAGLHGAVDPRAARPAEPSSRHARSQSARYAVNI